MKNLKLFAVLVLTAFLAACADSGGGSGNGDISDAKSLAKKFEQTNKFSQGYINPNNTRQVVQTMLTFGNNATHFYQMHRIGCIVNGKPELLVNERQHTAELIVGTNGKEASYLQFNDDSRCYIASAQVYTPFGNKSWNWGDIPRRACQNVQAELVVKRIDKKDVKRYRNPYYTQQQHAYANPNTSGDDYWNWTRPDYSNAKEEDSYFDVYRGFRGESLRYRSSAVGDRFSKYGSDKAVFVTENIRNRKDSDCEKVVYYGRSIPKNSLLHVQFFTTQPYHKK